MTVLCECCELPLASCGKAAETKQRQEAAAERKQRLVDGWMEAKWPGKCLRCGEFFKPRDLIHPYAQGWACC